MAERTNNSPSSSRTKKLRFLPKAPISKEKKASGKSSIQQEIHEIDEDKIVSKEAMRRLMPRQAVWKIAVGKDADSADQKPQSSSQAHSQLEKKEKKSEPYIVLPLRPDNTNSEELDKMEFGQSSLTSAEMEASINPAKDLGLENESEQERMLIFKFPNPLPMEVPASIAEETENKGKKKAKKMGCSLQQLPAGYVGKMLVYKSGKVKMKLGDVIFNVDPGANCICHEQAVVINPKKRDLRKLGNIDEPHVVVTPDVDSLLEEIKKLETPSNIL